MKMILKVILVMIFVCITCVHGRMDESEKNDASIPSKESTTTTHQENSTKTDSSTSSKGNTTSTHQANSTICIVLLGLQFNLKYNTTENKTTNGLFNVPTADSKNKTACVKSNQALTNQTLTNQTLTIDWGRTSNMAFYFTEDAKTITVSEIQLFINVSEYMNDAKADQTINLVHRPKNSSIHLGESHKDTVLFENSSDKTETLNVTYEVTISRLPLTYNETSNFTDVPTVQPGTNTPKSDSITENPETSSVKPGTNTEKPDVTNRTNVAVISTLSILAALIVIALVAFVIWHKRARSRAICNTCPLSCSKTNDSR